MSLEKTNNSMIIKYKNTDNMLDDICSIINSAKDFAYQSVNLQNISKHFALSECKI